MSPYLRQPALMPPALSRSATWTVFFLVTQNTNTSTDDCPLAPWQAASPFSAVAAAAAAVDGDVDRALLVSRCIIDFLSIFLSDFFTLTNTLVEKKITIKSSVNNSLTIVKSRHVERSFRSPKKIPEGKAIRKDLMHL